MVCGKEGSKMIERSIQVCAEFAYDKRQGLGLNDTL